MLRESDWTRATVNGKKCGFVFHNGKVWLLSYSPQWDHPTLNGYDTVPLHGFAKRTVFYGFSIATVLQDWNSVRAWGIEHWPSLESIYFPGEEGYERNIRRRNRRTSGTDNATEAQTPTNETSEQPSIDFYLPQYRTDNVYRGLNGYHNSHRRGFMNSPVTSYTGHRIGVELEVEAKDSALRREIVDKTSNWFTRETDGSLNEHGVEFITIPLLPDDAKSYTTWQPLCEYLKTRAKSWDTGRCGLHVHIGREILGDTESEQQMTLGKLLIFYQGDVEDWVKATAVFGRERCYHQPDGDTEELKAVKVLGKNVLKDPEVYGKVDRAMKARFTRGRYYAINLTNAHTIEFRKGRGSINADRIIAVITMTEAICLFAKATEPYDLTLENFRRWLYMNVPCGNPLYRYIGEVQSDH